MHNRELEIKLLTDAVGLTAALSSQVLGGDMGDAPIARTIVSTYFDTPEHALRKRRIALRVRKVGRAAPLQTVKWQDLAHGNAFSRGEVEVRGGEDAPDLALFGDDIAAELRDIAADQPLEARFETRIKRHTRLVSAGTASIEVAFDDGEIVVGDRRARVCEIELELKSGDPSELYELASRAVGALPLRLDISSKSERGYFLADGAIAAPVKARGQDFAPGATVDDAISAIIGDTLMHFLANLAPLRSTDDPEGIHQLRVSLRRMRAALGIFKRLAPSAEFELFRLESKRIASALGPARECDAFVELLEEGPRRSRADATVFAGIDSALARRRDTLYADARKLVDAQETSIFVLKLQAFLARRGWRNTVQSQQLAALTAPAAEFGGATLDRLRKRVLKRGRNLVSLPDEERHEVRIALKKLRYAAEFFGALYDDASAYRPYVRAVSRLQGILGAHNDAAGAQSLLDLLESRRQADTAFAAGLVLGWCERNAEVADVELREAWRRFKRLDPFWR